MSKIGLPEAEALV